MTCKGQSKYKMTNINIEIPDEVHRKLKIVCAMNSLSIKDFIIESVNISQEKYTKKSAAKAGR